MKKVITILMVIAMLMSMAPMTQAAIITDKSENIIALQLKASDIKWAFGTLDNENMTYVGGSISDENTKKIVEELSSLSQIQYIGSGKTMAGHVLIRTKANTRFSYYLESETILNINGSRYRISEKQADRIRNTAKYIAEDEYSCTYPKWFAWMNPSNVTGFTQYQPLLSHKDFVPDSYDFDRVEFDSTVGPEWYDQDEPSPYPAEVSFITRDMFSYAQYFDIEKGERYEPGSVQLPKDKEYYEMTVNFKSGVYYKVMVYGTTLLLESSDMSYGCKYTLKSRHKNNYGTIREAYYHWTDILAHPPIM